MKGIFKIREQNFKMDDLEIFKSAIDKIRDVFRRATPSITGMDSMKHLTIYILHRFLTIEKCQKYQIPEEFGWENMIQLGKTTVEGWERSRLLLAGQRGSLISYIDKFFKTGDFIYNVKNWNIHKIVLETIENINLTDLHSEIDIIGLLYESHLTTGASSARDLGQFFTNRQITQYMVRLCNPKVINGVPESVCDPTMGTAGFLTTYVKYLEEENVDWKIHQSQVHGCDTEKFVSAIAKINMFLETDGVLFDDIKLQNSLNDDLPMNDYDIILANMPFGLKNLTHAECCERVKDLKIRGTKSEPLFLQLMMVSLKLGGRCAVVIPDGVLTNITKIAIDTRRYLLDNFELKKIVKMKGKFFMNTSIQPTILFFKNTGKSTKKISFYEVSKDEEENVVAEKKILSIDISQLNQKNLVLDVRKFQKVENPFDGNIINNVKIGDLLAITKGKNIPERDRVSDGLYPYYGANGITGYTNEFLIDDTVILLSAVRTTNEKIYFVEGKIYPSSATLIINCEDKRLLKFIYYQLKFIDLDGFVKSSSLIPTIDIDKFKDFNIMMSTHHSLIVDMIDKVYLSNIHLDEMIGLIIKTMENIINSDECEKKKLGDISNFFSGKGNYERGKGKIPYYDSNGIVGMVESPLYEGEYIITARKMSVGNTHYINGAFYPSDNTIVFQSSDPETVLTKYLYYWFFHNSEILKNMSNGIKPGIRKEDLKELMIPIPSLERQEEIVQHFDEMTSQIENFEKLKIQSETSAKLLLKSYLE